MNFAVWTLFSIIGLEIKSELNLTETQFGILVGLPILTGALSRVPLGMLTDRYGGRIVFFLQMVFVSLSTFALSAAITYEHYLVIGLLLGLAGGSVTIGIIYTTTTFTKNEQPKAIALFGAGNIGAIITNVAAPLILLANGWQTVPQVYAVALLIVAVIFLFVSRDTHSHPNNRPQLSFSQQIESLSQLRVWRFGLYYFFVFGGFVALTLWLPHYYMEEYGLGIREASFATLFFVLPACLIRATSNWFSRRYTARQINWGTFWVCIVCLFFLSYPSTTMTIHGVKEDIHWELKTNVYMFSALLMIMGMAMGFGKASIFRIIHNYYPEKIGTVGGLVGAIGGMGGFVLPVMFGLAVDITGIRSSCFMLLYGVLGICMIWMYYAIQLDGHLDRIRNAINSDFLKD